MRALIQRVKNAAVSIDGSVHGAIGAGMLIFVGVRNGDSDNDAQYLARRCADLRIFADAAGAMNLSVRETKGSALVVSQFTLYADSRKGNRPSFTDAAAPVEAEKLYNRFVDSLRGELGQAHVSTGMFRAMMEVSLVNDGPVTIMVESKSPV